MTEGQYNSSPYGAWEAAGGFPAAGGAGAFRQAPAPGQTGEFNQAGISPPDGEALGRARRTRGVGIAIRVWDSFPGRRHRFAAVPTAPNPFCGR